MDHVEIKPDAHSNGML